MTEKRDRKAKLIPHQNSTDELNLQIFLQPTLLLNINWLSM